MGKIQTEIDRIKELCEKVGGDVTDVTIDPHLYDVIMFELAANAAMFDKAGLFYKRQSTEYLVFYSVNGPIKIKRGSYE